MVVGVPVGITNVETRAVYDAARTAGAREGILLRSLLLPLLVYVCQFTTQRVQ